MILYNRMILVFVVFLTLLVSTTASAALIFFDGFETPTVNNSELIDLYDTNWRPNLGAGFPGTPTVLEFQSEGYYSGGFTAPEGNQWVELASQNPNRIKTFLSLVPGQQYELSFFLGLSPAQLSAGSNNRLYVQLALTGIGNPTLRIDTGGLSAGWYEYFIPFTAPTALENPLNKLTVLRFANEDNIDDGIGPLLDAVAINAVPIPGAVWLLGTGLVGLVTIRRRLKK